MQNQKITKSILGARNLGARYQGYTNWACCILQNGAFLSFVLGGGGGFAQGWFWKMVPCTEISSEKSVPAVLPWQKKPMIFEIPGPPKPERGHIRQNRPCTKPAKIVASREKALWGAVPSTVLRARCDALSSTFTTTRITKPYSERIQTVPTTSPNCTWKQSKPYSICTQTQR